VDRKIGPLPTPMMILNVAALVVLLVGIGGISAAVSVGWTILRLVGVGLSFYCLVMLPWTMRTLDHFGVPGAALLHDHELVTSGPYRLARHPGHSAYIAIWLETALGTLNWLLLALFSLGVAGAFLSSRAVEKLLHQRFDREYEEYAGRTNRFYPGIW